jgi:hypothetical protein
MVKKPKKDLRRDIIAKAIVDPSFRRKLLKSPETVFGEKPSEADLAALERLKRFLPALDDIVTSLAGEVLCGGGGGCGGLA